MLTELHKKINNIIPIDGLSILDDGIIVINYINMPTLEQEELINNALNNFPLDNAKYSKLLEIEEDWKNTLKNGWQTPNGWKLGIDIQDITLLTGLFMLAKEAANLGINEPITIIDMDGQAHGLSLQELTTLMLQYGSARALLSTEYANRRNLVNQATTIEEIENI